MNQSKYAFQAGLFILLSIAAAIYLVARVAESRSAPSDATTYVAVFPAGQDVAGLSDGAEVRLLGVRVGRVESVQVSAPAEPGQDASIRVTFSLGQGVTLRTDNPQVKLQTALTGGAWLNIMSLGSGTALADGSEVDGTSDDLMVILGDVRDDLGSVSHEAQITLAAVREDMDVVSAELVETADSIERSANTATDLIEEIDTQVVELVPHATAMLDHASGVMTDLRSIVGEEEDPGQDIRTILANLASLSDTLDTELPQTLTRVTGFVDRTEQSLEGVDGLVAELTGTAEEARDMLTSNRPEIDRTVLSIRRSVDELEGLVDDLRANPSRLIWPPEEEDLNNMELYAAARAYANAAEDLQAAADALNAATANGVTHPDEIQALREDLMRQFDYFDNLQQQMWQRFEE